MESPWRPSPRTRRVVVSDQKVPAGRAKAVAPPAMLVMAVGHRGWPEEPSCKGSPVCQRRVALAPAGWMVHLVRLLSAISRPSGRRPVKWRPAGGVAFMDPECKSAPASGLFERQAQSGSVRTRRQRRVENCMGGLQWENEEYNNKRSKPGPTWTRWSWRSNRHRPPFRCH